MIVEAQKGDETALETFLAKHFATTMFMRGNLRDFGLGNTEAPYGMRYFMCLEDNKITGVGALANIGAIMLQANEARKEIVAHIAGILPSGFIPNAITGGPAQVSALVDGLELSNAPTKMNDVEPLFALNLAQLKRPDMEGFTLRPSKLSDLPLLADWNQAYNIEVLGETDTEATRKEALKEAAHTIKRGHQRLLIKAGEIVAQTNFNAVLPDAAQIGGVYTPPSFRGQGYARRAVGAHLAEAFSIGIEHAILFSASEAASKAYCAVGFECIGEYQIILFEAKA